MTYLKWCAASLVFSLLYLAGNAQQQPDGGGSYRLINEIKDEMTPEQREAIIAVLQQNEKTLRQAGKLKTNARTMHTALAWPLQQAPGLTIMDITVYQII